MGVVAAAACFWIRPVAPANAHMALRIVVHELERLVKDGISESDFQATRNYLTKNVYLLTATQDQQLGYALDSDWYGTGDLTRTMREHLGRLTRDDVNRAIRAHLSATDLAVVIIAKDAEGLRQALLADGFSSITYKLMPTNPERMVWGMGDASGLRGDDGVVRPALFDLGDFAEVNFG